MQNWSSGTVRKNQRTDWQLPVSVSLLAQWFRRYIFFQTKTTNLSFFLINSLHYFLNTVNFYLIKFYKSFYFKTQQKGIEDSVHPENVGYIIFLFFKWLFKLTLHICLTEINYYFFKLIYTHNSFNLEKPPVAKMGQ